MLQIQQDVPLAPLTTFRIGGPARFFARIETEEHLVEALGFAESRHLSVFILGGGSNLLVPDTGFPGLALQIAITRPNRHDGKLLDVAAGADWDALVLETCQRGISGMECLAGIPGLVGASPIQNIGAYGQEAAQTIHSVRAYDRQLHHFVTPPRAECHFAYRESIFNTSERNRYIITAVTFALDPVARPHLEYPDLRNHFAARPSPSPLDVYHAVRTIRRAKGMILLPEGSDGIEDTRSAGSFFKNPIVPASALARIAQSLGIPEASIPRYPAPAGHCKLPAAWLVEQAGFRKSYALGKAAISSRHTLALINRGHATYADIAHLRDRILASVGDRFGISLQQEPVEPRE